MCTKDMDTAEIFIWNQCTQYVHAILFATSWVAFFDTMINDYNIEH